MAKSGPTKPAAIQKPVQPAEPGRPELRRAEDLLDQLGQRAGEWSSRLGLRLRRRWARAREEAEDIVAEAQSLRQGEKS